MHACRICQTNSLDLLITPNIEWHAADTVYVVQYCNRWHTTTIFFISKHYHSSLFDFLKSISLPFRCVWVFSCCVGFIPFKSGFFGLHVADRPSVIVIWQLKVIELFHLVGENEVRHSHLIFSFIRGQYLAQIKIQIVKQIGCVGQGVRRFLKKFLSKNWLSHFFCSTEEQYLSQINSNPLRKNEN